MSSRPFCLTNPSPRSLGRDRRNRIFHPGADHGILPYSSIDALQPLIPPPDTFMQEIDHRTGSTHMRIFMSPWAYKPFAGSIKLFHQPENRIGITVGPTTHGKDRTTHS